MNSNSKFNFWLVVGSIAVAFLCYWGYVYFKSHPSTPKILIFIWGIIVILDIICLEAVWKLLWNGFFNGIGKVWEWLKPKKLKRKQEEKKNRQMNELFTAISHINGLMEAASWDANKIDKIVKIIDRIGFSDFQKNMLLADKLHAEFSVPEDNQTKRRYLKDWVELMAANGELSDQGYRKCCDMATKYNCSTDIIKEIMEETGVTLISKETMGGAKEEGRYYFYNDRCSFKLPKEEIMQDDVEKNGLKHTLMTSSMMMTILEIRPGMPNFPSSVQTKQTTVSGYPCLAAKVNPIIDDYSQYYINCKEFVVQVSMTIVSEKFLNSFRLER